MCHTQPGPDADRLHGAMPSPAEEALRIQRELHHIPEVLHHTAQQYGGVFCIAGGTPARLFLTHRWLGHADIDILCTGFPTAHDQSMAIMACIDALAKRHGLQTLYLTARALTAKFAPHPPSTRAQSVQFILRNHANIRGALAEFDLGQCMIALHRDTVYTMYEVCTCNTHPEPRAATPVPLHTCPEPQ